MKLTVEGMEKERDFYFNKLRDIEVICQEPEYAKNTLTTKILDILYATEVSPFFCLFTFWLTSLSDARHIKRNMAYTRNISRGGS